MYGLSEVSEISKAIFLDIHPVIKKLTPAGNAAKIVGKTLLNGLASKIGFDIENLNEDTIKQLHDIDIVVVGSFITNYDNYQEQIDKLNLSK